LALKHVVVIEEPHPQNGQKHATYHKAVLLEASGYTPLIFLPQGKQQLVVNNEQSENKALL
jgi:hypothetical protein